MSNQALRLMVLLCSWLLDTKAVGRCLGLDCGRPHLTCGHHWGLSQRSSGAPSLLL